MQKKLKVSSLSLSMLMILAACSYAANDKVDAVKQTFEKHFPGKTVNSVSATPIKGIYEIVVGGKEIVYANPDVSYLLVGDLVDVAKKESLTEKKMLELRKVDTSTLPVDKAIKEVRGKGGRKLFVFSDPDCPFCKKLERESLNGIDNVTIYTFLYPLTQLHPDALNKAQKIWCAKDRAATWGQFMRNNTVLPEAMDCKTPLEDIRQLGEKLNITGTPALIFANGRMVPGAIDKENIEKLLDAK